MRLFHIYFSDFFIFISVRKKDLEKLLCCLIKLLDCTNFTILIVNFSIFLAKFLIKYGNLFGFYQSVAALPESIVIFTKL